jgi:hypothetical protein
MVNNLPLLVKIIIMEKYIKYKRFNETHDQKSIQTLYDKLVTEGWDIIYYKEIQQPSGMLSSSPQEENIHVVILAGKRQNDTLNKPTVL